MPEFNPTKPARVGVHRHVAVVKTEHEVVVPPERIVRLGRLDASVVDTGLTLGRPMKVPPPGHTRCDGSLAVLHLHHKVLGTTLNGTYRRTDKPGLEAFRKRKTEVRSTLIDGDHTTTVHASARPRRTVSTSGNSGSGGSHNEEQMLVFEPLEVDDLFEDEPCISKFVLDLHAQAIGIRATVTFDLQREQTAPSVPESAHRPR